MNPTRAEYALAPRPETLPAAQIHPIRDPKSEALEGREDSEFFRCRYKGLSRVRRPRLNLGSGLIQMGPPGDLRICTSKLGHLGLMQELKTALVPEGHWEAPYSTEKYLASR